MNEAFSFLALPCPALIFSPESDQSCLRRRNIMVYFGVGVNHGYFRLMVLNIGYCIILILFEEMVSDIRYCIILTLFEQIIYPDLKELVIFIYLFNFLGMSQYPTWVVG